MSKSLADQLLESQTGEGTQMGPWTIAAQPDGSWTATHSKTGEQMHDFDLGELKNEVGNALYYDDEGPNPELQSSADFVDQYEDELFSWRHSYDPDVDAEYRGRFG